MHSAATVEVGTIVRVDLHGRRVGGWVVELTDEPTDGVDVDRLKPIVLKPIVKVTGAGPVGRSDRTRGVGVGALGRPADPAVPRHGVARPCRDRAAARVADRPRDGRSDVARHHVAARRRRRCAAAATAGRPDAGVVVGGAVRRESGRVGPRHRPVAVPGGVPRDTPVARRGDRGRRCRTTGRSPRRASTW